MRHYDHHSRRHEPHSAFAHLILRPLWYMRLVHRGARRGAAGDGGEAIERPEGGCKVWMPRGSRLELFEGDIGSSRRFCFDRCGTR